MAHGLVKIGSGRILPAPRSSVMNIIGLSAGGGSPGGGYNPGGSVFLELLLPNTAETDAIYWREAAGDGWPTNKIDWGEDEEDLTTEEKNAISAPDENYVEEIHGSPGWVQGHCMRYDLTDKTYARLRSTCSGYAWRTEDSAYGWKAAVWDFVLTEHLAIFFHEHSVAAMATRHLDPPDDYVDENDIVSQLTQGIGDDGGWDENLYLRDYYMSLSLFS